MDPDKIEVIRVLFPVIGVACAVGVAGWVITTWLRIKHGYPLAGPWGQAVYPKTTSAEMERISLLAQENSQLRDELGALKLRLANVERIVTDPSLALTSQIAALAVTGKDA